MKAYKIFATALLAACPLVGCEDFLNLKPLNDIVLENFWNEKSDVDNMISGCYSTMQSRDFVERLMVWGEVRSDNIVAGNNVNGNVDYSNIFQENLRENNGFTKWDKFYSVINSCNLIIQYAPQVAQKSPDYTQSALRATIAEATALRLTRSIRPGASHRKPSTPCSAKCTFGNKTMPNASIMPTWSFSQRWTSITRNTSGTAAS